MHIAIGAGIFFALAGLAGLGWCVWQASAIKSGELSGEAARKVLNRISAVNLASVGLAFLGLAAVAAGIILG